MLPAIADLGMGLVGTRRRASTTTTMIILKFLSLQVVVVVDDFTPMKILTLALAALLGTSNAVRLSGEYTSDVKLTTKIMENAKYYSGRELNDGGNGFEITAAHTILFRSCESMTVQAEFGNGNDDGTSETIKTMYKSGTVKAQKSYILFDVCLSDYCDSGKASDRTTFITDMASFINAFLEFIPNKTKAYCQGCFDNQNYCSYEAQKVYTGNTNSQMTYGSSNNNGGNRFLENNNNNNNANVERKLHWTEWDDTFRHPKQC
jgi:hypothetical protein